MKAKKKLAKKTTSETKRTYILYDYTYLIDHMLDALEQMEHFHRSDKAKTVSHLETADEIHKAINDLEAVRKDNQCDDIIQYMMIQDVFYYIGRNLMKWWD